MGSYCKFCGQRCFVVRLIPDGPSKGWSGCLATCQKGMMHDQKVTGYTHLTAINPVTEPDAAEAVYAWSAGRKGRKAAALAVDADEFERFAGEIKAMVLLQPGVMTDADWLAVALVLRDRPRDYPLARSYWDKAESTLSREDAAS